MQQLSDPQPAPGLEFNDEPVPCGVRAVDHLIYGLPDKDLSRHLPGHPEGRGEQRCMAGVLHVQAAFFDDEGEERLYLGIPEPPGRLGMVLGEILQKGEELIGREGLKETLSILGAESLQGVSIAVEGSFSYVRSLMTLKQAYRFLY